jgi:hypothetical protein
MHARPLRKLVRLGRGSKRERRYKTVRHQLLHNPSVPGILDFLGVQMRAVQIGWLLAPERDLMRNAGWPGI